MGARHAPGPARPRHQPLDPQDRGVAASRVPVAIGSPAVCPEWSAGRALAAGADEDDITGVPLAITPVTGLSRASAQLPGRELGLLR
jgi:hypothetical protein